MTPPALCCPHWLPPPAATAAVHSVGQTVSRQRSQPAAWASLSQPNMSPPNCLSDCVLISKGKHKMSQRSCETSEFSWQRCHLDKIKQREKLRRDFSWAQGNTGCICAGQQSLLLHSPRPVGKASSWFSAGAALWIACRKRWDYSSVAWG